MAARAAAARHVCRISECGRVIDPQANAHAMWVNHMRTTHLHRSLSGICHTECGGRAKPSEGRYTKVIREGTTV